MPSKYQNLRKNIKDLSENCPGFGDYYSLLGGEKGYCFGLVFMWGQAVLANDHFTYFQRLTYLTQEYPSSRGKMLSDYVNDVNGYFIDISVKDMDFSPRVFPLSYQDYIVSTIRAFLDGLLLYQCPVDTSIAKKDNSLYMQNAINSSKYVLNNALSQGFDNELISLAKVYDRPFVGDKDMYNRIICALLEEARKLKVPFFVCCSSGTHSIGLTLIENNFTRLYNANFMHKNLFWKDISSLDECVYRLFKAFSNPDKLAVNIQVYLRPSDKNKSLSIINNMYSEVTQQRYMHISRELRNYANPKEIWKNLTRHHQKRAMFTADILRKNSSNGNDFLYHYLEEEHKLCNGMSIDNQVDVYHYKDNRVTTNNNGRSAYYKIIENACSETPMQIEYRNYFQLYLPEIIEKGLHINSLFLVLACQGDHIDIAMELLKTYEIDVNQTTARGTTPLWFACFDANDELIFLLLGKNPKKCCCEDITVLDVYKTSCEHKAKTPDPEILNFLENLT